MRQFVAPVCPGEIAGTLQVGRTRVVVSHPAADFQDQTIFACIVSTEAASRSIIIFSFESNQAFHTHLKHRSRDRVLMLEPLALRKAVQSKRNNKRCVRHPPLVVALFVAKIISWPVVRLICGWLTKIPWQSVIVKRSTLLPSSVRVRSSRWK